MYASDFVKFMEHTLKMQKDSGRYQDDGALYNGVYFHRYGNTVMLMSMNGHELYWEKFGELDEAGALGWLAAGRLDEAQKEGLFPCKITTADMAEKVLPLLKAAKSRSNDTFHWEEFIRDSGRDDRGVIKAVLFGKNFDLPIRVVSDKQDEGFMLLWRKMVVREECFQGRDGLEPTGQSLSLLGVSALAMICAWFTSRANKSNGISMQVWDSVSGDGSRSLNHALVWPDNVASKASDAECGAITMCMRPQKY